MPTSLNYIVNSPISLPPVPPGNPGQVATPVAATGPATGPLVSVAVLNRGNTLQATFAATPLQASRIGRGDALNVSNWILTGPGNVTIVLASIVRGDTKSIYLTLSGPLPHGNWSLTPKNVTAPDGTPL
jgi:hypothetical protein